MGLKKDQLKMGDPAASVLVPVYNNARYLRECLDSLIGQTLKNIELIIVNDGSTDPDALRILEDYERKDSRIRLVHKPNTGYGHSLNTAIDMARGAYLGIVESDDFVHRNMYEILCKTAARGGLDFVRSNCAWFVDHDGRRLYKVQKTLPKTRKYYTLYTDCQDRAFYRMPVFNQTGLYRASFIRQNNIRFNETPGAAYQDNGFFFQALMFARRIAFVDPVLYFLRRDNAASSVNSGANPSAIFTEYAFIRNKIEERPELKNKVLGAFHLRKFKSCLFHLKRVDPELKKEFLNIFASEFALARDSGDLDLSLFNPEERKLLASLLENQESFLINNGSRNEYLKKEKESQLTSNKEIFRVSFRLPLLRFALGAGAHDFFDFCHRLVGKKIRNDRPA